MKTYITFSLPITDPESGETREIKLFGLAEHSVSEWEKIFSKPNEYADIMKEPFKISKPMDIKEIQGFPGFLDFIDALENEDSE